MEYKKGPSQRWLNLMKHVQPSHPILTQAVRIRPRRIWNAKPKVPALGAVYQAPPKYVLIGYSPKKYKERFPPGYLPGPKPHTLDVIGELQFTQYVDMELNKMADIRYNFMIGGDGIIYEGRGWSRSPDLPMKYRNITSSSFYLSFIGDFREISFADRIVPQEEWKELQPAFVPRLRPPASYLVFGYPQPWKRPRVRPDIHGGPSEYGSSLADARKLLKTDLVKYPDTKYNFLMAPDGLVYEGRGFYKIPSLPVKMRPINHLTYYLGFLGDFTMEYPPEYMFQMRNEFIVYAIKQGFLNEKFQMFTLRNQIQSEFDDFDFVTGRPTLTRY